MASRRPPFSAARRPLTCRGRALWVGSSQSRPQLGMWPTWMGDDWDDGFSSLRLGIGICRSTSPESLSALLELG
ncbi:hypothetical protein ACFX1Z_024115 [Malus domestica]